MKVSVCISNDIISISLIGMQQRLEENAYNVNNVLLLRSLESERKDNDYRTTTRNNNIKNNTTRTVASARGCGRPGCRSLWYAEEPQHMDQLILGELTTRNSFLNHPQIEGPALLIQRRNGACDVLQRGGR